VTCRSGPVESENWVPPNPLIDNPAYFIKIKPQLGFKSSEIHPESTPFQTKPGDPNPKPDHGHLKDGCPKVP
jgi:hypothetical protein